MAERAILPVLRQRGIRRLNTLLVSHGDRDHSAGLASLQAALSPARLLVGADLSGTPDAQPCRAGLAWQWRDDVRFQLLAPAPGERLSRNDGSCVLRAVLPGTELLLPGDISAARERVLVRYWGEHLRSSLALAAHHGSQTSSSWAWLGHVRPGLVIYTNGRANAFGHPAAGVVRRHQALGIETLSTADTGALEWVLEPGKPPGLLQHPGAATAVLEALACSFAGLWPVRIMQATLAMDIDCAGTRNGRRLADGADPALLYSRAGDLR